MLTATQLFPPASVRLTASVVGPVRTVTRRVRFFVMLVLSGWCRFALDARAQTTQEYDLKAVLLYNFTQFVNWPPESGPHAEPWVIGVLGRDPFGRVLDDVVRAETHQGRRIVIERYRSIDAVRDCHILFICESEAGNLPHILSAIKNRPILSVGDFEGFALRGGMIRFKKSSEGKIQLRINLPAVKSSGLTVSAKLLQVAEVVSPPPS